MISKGLGSQKGRGLPRGVIEKSERDGGQKELSSR